MGEGTPLFPLFPPGPYGRPKTCLLRHPLTERCYGVRAHCTRSTRTLTSCVFLHISPFSCHPRRKGWRQSRRHRQAGVGLASKFCKCCYIDAPWSWQRAELGDGTWGTIGVLPALVSKCMAGHNYWLSGPCGSLPTCSCLAPMTFTPASVLCWYKIPGSSLGASLRGACCSQHTHTVMTAPHAEMVPASSVHRLSTFLAPSADGCHCAANNWDGLKACLMN